MASPAQRLPVVMLHATASDGAIVRKMCRPAVLVRSRHNAWPSVIGTVFAFRQERGEPSATLGFHLDNASLSDPATTAIGPRPVVLNQLPRHSLHLHRVTVTDCAGRGHHQLEPHCDWLGMCLLDMRLDPHEWRLPCSLKLAWHSLSLHATVELCESTTHGAGPRQAAACATTLIAPATQRGTAALTWLMAINWARNMSSQVQTLHLHVFNRGTEARRVLEAAVPRLLSEGRLVVHAWDWLETLADLGGYVEVASDSAMFSFMERLRVNANTKCLLEERGAARWMQIMDTDETFDHAEGVAPLTLSEVSAQLNASFQQQTWCQFDQDVHCVRQWRVSRPKSMVRLDGSCRWWGAGHYSVPLRGSSPACSPADALRTGRIFAAYPSAKADFWDYWGNFSNGVSPGCQPSPPYFLVHDRQTNWLHSWARGKECRRQSAQLLEKPWSALVLGAGDTVET